ncbi:unnamed protein product [Symbiodinium microadriaticum]|nr:unnamed protein product [Symbiodinium microadriaticum]CAE7819592.1 unnamed protein product [Symbiodinium sp. KB8]
MTTPRGAAEHEPPDALPGPSELLPTFVGNPEVRIPWLDAARDTSDDVVELPWDCRPPDPPGDGWLGIQVYSPFYRTVPFACSERRCRNTHQVVDAIRDFVGGVPHDLFPVLVPILPQRFTEYGGFIRSPRFTRHSDGSGLTAVIFDLSRVGGRYFADVVPGRMSYQEMIDHVYCYTAHCDHPLCFFVGCRQAAWPHGQPFQLQDGVAITVTSIPDFHNQASTFEDLLANKSLWGPVAQMPLLEPLHGTLVQHENERFFIAPYHQEGEGLPAAVARRIRRPLVDLTTCSFAIKDFDYKGYACDQILAVFNLPWPGSNRLQGKRRDIFTLCDGRALGMVPLVLHSAHPVIHLPSLAANLALRIPSAWCLDAVGGKRVEDEVFVGGHSTIMLYMHRESSDSEPDGEGPEISSDADSGESLHGQLDVANEYPVPPLAQPEHPPWRQRAVTVVTHAEATDTAAHHGSPSDQRLADATDLGGVVFAPHYQAEFFAIGVHAAEGLSEVVGRIKASALHLPLADLPGFVEVQPLPYTGFCAFVAFSEVVPANDNVAVVLDLSRVDGNIFAVVLPAKLDFDAWDPYVRALFPRPIQDYDLFNGVQAQPHAHGDPLYLQAGRHVVGYACLLMRHKLLDEPTPGTHSGRSALFIRDDEDSETELDLGRGVGVFLALPAWHINQAIVCVDAREIDGRLFAAPSPAYIDYQSCLVIACLPEIPSLQAWLGFEGAQVDEEVRHVTDGTTLFLTTSDRAPQPQDSLGQNLLFRERWSFADLTGPVRGVETYCLVAGGDQILYCDASLHGFECRTVIAIGRYVPGVSDGSFEVLLDARALSAGWVSVPADGRGVSVRRLLDACGSDVPPGWKVQIKGCSDHAAILSARPGQVFTAILVPAVDATAWARESATPSPDVPAGSSAHHTSRRGQGPLREPTAPNPTGPDNDTSGSRRDHAAGDIGVLEGVFRVLGQNYRSEFVSVRMPLNLDPVAALHMISAARHPASSALLPRLCVVHPQPYSSYALVLALPAWQPDGAVVVFDCVQLNGRLFALQIGRTVDRQGLLNAAQDIAEVVADPPAELVVVPAQPALVDHAFLGFWNRNVLAAWRAAPSATPRDPICFLDQRPVLHQVLWVRCPDGLLALGPVFEWHLWRCPPGFQVCVRQGSDHFDDPNQALRVYDGEVLTILFLPCPPQDPPADEDENFRPDGGDEPPSQGGARNARRSRRSTGSDAGTGGSHGHASSANSILIAMGIMAPNAE